MQRLDRGDFLKAATVLGGAALLPACGSSSSSSPSSSAAPPPISSEPGNLSILEWQGYEAAGTKAQKYMKIPGNAYTQKYGANSITYSYIVNDSQALAKASTTPFDLMHPCNENTRLRDARAGAAVGHQASAELREAQPVSDQAARSTASST